MEPETLPQAGEEQAAEQAPAANDEVAKLRQEAAKWRTQLREMQAKWKDAEPVLAEYQKLQESQKTDAQKVQERLAEMERQLAEKTSAADRAAKEAKLVKLAVPLGIDTATLDLLDLSKLDLEDEKGTLEKLSKLAAAKQVANAGSNPGRGGSSGVTDDELRNLYFKGGGNKPLIFGGN